MTRKLTDLMGVVHRLGGGHSSDDMLQIIAHAAIDIVGFDAVAVNVRREGGDLEVRVVVGPPELETMRGGRSSRCCSRVFGRTRR